MRPPTAAAIKVLRNLQLEHPTSESFFKKKKWGWIVLAGIVFFLLAVPRSWAFQANFDLSRPSPLTMNVGDTSWVRFDVTFDESDFDTLFLHIPNRPPFFTFWRERRIPGPGNYIYDKIIFTPGLQDGGHYFFQVIAGGIRSDGSVVADTLIFELRVRPFVFQEPEYTGGTTNTIYWMPDPKLYDQWIFIFSENSPATAVRSARLSKQNLGEIFQNTFENLQHGVKYGFYVKGFTQDSTVVYSDTVYSIQDGIPPEFVDSSWGREGPGRTVDLFWHPVQDGFSYVSGYVIFRRMANSGFQAIDTVWTPKVVPPDTTFHYWDSPGDLIEGQKYYYKISALDAGLNVGDGQQFGPFVPDETPPGPPTFYWHAGYGFDYELDHPIGILPNMGYTEKTWYKKGLKNTVYVINPKKLSGFEGLKSADSLRFVAVRDSSKFFFDEWQPGMQYFDSWMSPWIPIDQFPDSLVYYTFDFTNGGQNDAWFVHGHFYKFRAQFKDKAGNVGPWSRLNEKGWLVGEFQDAFPPTDIRDLELFIEKNPAAPGGGYFRLEWDASKDPVSGVKVYHVLRKFGQNGQFQDVAQVRGGPDHLVFRDAFANFDVNAMVYYRIVAEDNVGNLFDWRQSQWEVAQRAPVAPKIHFVKNYTLIHSKRYTPDSKATVAWDAFDLTGVNAMFLYAAGGDSFQVDPAVPQAEVNLVEGENRFYAKLFFSNNLISPRSNELILYRDSTPPSEIASLEVKNDPAPAGDLYINWSPAQDVLPVTYEIYRAEGRTGDFERLGTTDQTSWVDLARKPNGRYLKAFQTYRYRVVPVDQLGNRNETGAAQGENFCNSAPKLTAVNYTGDSLVVRWRYFGFPDTSVVPFDSLRFDVKVFQDTLPPRERLNSFPVYRQESVFGKDVTTFPAEAGAKYFVVVRAVELTSGAFHASAWSRSRFSDAGLSIIPPIDTLFVQPQPTDTTGIYVAWDTYWNLPFWSDHDKAMVGFFKLIRWEENDPTKRIERTYSPGSMAYTNLGILDKENLKPNVRYVYQVIPYEKKANDPPRFVPAGNKGQFVLNDTAAVKNFVDRVFVPKIDHLHAVNKATGKRYFHFMTPQDSVRMEWYWVYGKNGAEVEAPKGDFRGAETVELFVSNNPQFVNNPGFKKYTKKIRLLKKDLTNIDNFYYTYVKNLLDPDSFNLYEGKSIYVKVAAYDRWGHSPNYPTSAEFDGISEFVLDNSPPSETKIAFEIKSTPDTSEVPLVDIFVHWKPSTDRVSGLKEYRFEMFTKDGGADSVVLHIDHISPKDTSLTINRFELNDFYFENPVFFRLIPIDYAGNANMASEVLEFNFFRPPEILGAEWVSATGQVKLTWKKVPGADQYIVVWVTDKSYFSEDLRNSPAQREIIPGLNTHPEVISDTLNRTFNPNSKWIFRMLAVKEEKYESGWSNFFELEPQQSSGGNGSVITDAEENTSFPKTFALYQNYPNPFNPTTTITYDLPHPTRVELSIYNMKGQRIRTLVQGDQEAGTHQIIWDGKNFSGERVASGVYFYIMSTPEFHQVKKCLLMK